MNGLTREEVLQSKEMYLKQVEKHINPNYEGILGRKFSLVEMEGGWTGYF